MLTVCSRPHKTWRICCSWATTSVGRSWRPSMRSLAMPSTASGVRSSWLTSRVKTCSRSIKDCVRAVSASRCRASRPTSSSRLSTAKGVCGVELCPGRLRAMASARCTSGALMRRARHAASASAASVRPPLPHAHQSSNSPRTGRTTSSALTSATSKGWRASGTGGSGGAPRGRSSQCRW